MIQCKVHVLNYGHQIKDWNWQYHQHAVDFWIRDTLGRSLWNSSLETADIVYIDTDANYLCANFKQGKAKNSFYNNWKIILDIKLPKFTSAFSFCDSHMSGIAKRLNFTTLNKISRKQSIIVPYVVNKIDRSLVKFEKNI